MSKELTQRAREAAHAPSRMFGRGGFFPAHGALVQRMCAECADEKRDGDLQAKLAIGAPGDVYEREADQVADRILSGGSAAPGTPGISRIQRLPAGPGRASGHPVPQTRIDARRGAGRPLPPATRRFFEPRLGTDSYKKEDVMRAMSAQRPTAANPAESQATPAVAAPAAAPFASLSAVPRRPVIQRKCSCGSASEAAATVTARAKLPVGAATEPREREADFVAQQVVAMRVSKVPGGRLPGQRKCAACAAEEAERVRPQRAAAVGASGLAAQPDELSSGGSPLPEPTRRFFEWRIGRDFAAVRLHQGPRAEHLTQAISARAFTYRNHIWLGPAEGAGPSFTLAHELAHVMQQTAPGPSGDVGSAGWAPVSAAPPIVQRREVCDENGICWSEEGPEESVYRPSWESTIPSPGAEAPAADSGGTSTPEQTSAPGGPPATGAMMSLAPPGNCIQGIHDEMQRQVKAWCDHPSGRQCNATESCLRIHQKIRRNQMCAQARRAINDTCYGGGDLGHRIAERDARRAQANCEAERVARCRERPPPVPVPLPEPAKRPVRRPDPDFMERMAEITGLTGAALIAYLIISEGSRLFPPRNLIPVP